jgi:hypothetical protein
MVCAVLRAACALYGQHQATNTTHDGPVRVVGGRVGETSCSHSAGSS